jgi:hypothetical protein
VDKRVDGRGREDGHDAYRQARAAAVNGGSKAATDAAAKRGAGAAAGPAAGAATTSVRRGGVGAGHLNNSLPGQGTRLSTADDNDSTWGWRGAGPADMATLDSILDDCLAFGGGSGGAGF